MSTENLCLALLIFILKHIRTHQKMAKISHFTNKIEIMRALLHTIFCKFII